jgi:hypothetical protein
MDVQQLQQQQIKIISRVVKELLEGTGTIATLYISIPKDLCILYKRYGVVIQFNDIKVQIDQYIYYERVVYCLYVNEQELHVDNTMHVLLSRVMHSILDKATIREIIKSIDDNIVSYVHIDLQIPY